MARIPFKVNIGTPTWCKLPFKSPYNTLTQQMLLPHELFANIYRWYPATWAKAIMPSQDRLAEFWRVNSSHPCMRDSPLKLREGYQKFGIPISIHGDDVPITGVGKSWCQQMTTFSWCSMIGFGSVKDLSYFIFGCFDKLRAVSEDQSKDTLGVFFKILCWSLRWLYLGQWPDRDWNNKMYLWWFQVVLEIILFINFMSILTTPFKGTPSIFVFCTGKRQPLSYILTYIHTYIHRYIHTYIHTYIHRYIHTYIHTHIHGYIDT